MEDRTKSYRTCILGFYHVKQIGWAIGSMIAAFILDLTGFQANVTQNPNVLNGLKGMMSIIPSIAGVLALSILIFFYKLDEPLMKQVKEDLDKRRLEAETAEAKS